MMTDKTLVVQLRLLSSLLYSLSMFIIKPPMMFVFGCIRIWRSEIIVYLLPYLQVIFQYPDHFKDCICDSLTILLCEIVSLSNDVAKVHFRFQYEK